MFNALYMYFRGAVGFSIVLAGISMLISHRGERALRAFGNLCIAAGALYTMSALDSLCQLPVDLDNLAFQALMLALGISLLDIALYLFGNERHAGGRRKLVRAGIVYESALVLLPLLDYAFGLEAAFRDVEDSLVRGPIHAIAVQAGCAWPLAATGVALRIARWKPADIAGGHRETRKLVLVFRILLPFLGAIILSLVLSFRLPYEVGQVILEFLILAWYLYVVRNPRSLMKLRVEIGKEHAQRRKLQEPEIALIEKRLAEITARKDFILQEGLDLQKLAKLIGIPPYRLSIFFSSRLATSFIAWRNRLRVEYVCARMLERPDLTIPDISLEAGYRSKATFNTQFSRIVGMNPSEYRGKHGGATEKPSASSHLAH